MMGSRLRWILPGAVAAAAVAAAPAVGGPPVANWSEPTTISSASGAAGSVSAALDDRGDGVVFWNACTKSFQGGECPARWVNQARAFRGGSFERARFVSRGPVSLTRVDVREGRATASWLPFPKPIWRESTAQLGAGWGPPRISRPPEGGAASVDVNARGQGISAYLAGGPGSRTLVARYKRSASAPWGPPRLIARASAEPGFPTAFIDRDGRAIVTWTVPYDSRVAADDALQVKASTRRGNGTYATTNATPTTTAVSNVSVSANARGDIVVGYLACRPPIYDNLNGECLTVNVVEAAVRTAGARRFGKPKPVSTYADGNAFAPRFVMNSSRRAVAIWNDQTGLRSGTATRSGSWSRETLAPSAESTGIIATNAGSKGVAAWTQGDQGDGNQAVFAAPFGPEGTFGPATQVSDPAAFNASTPVLALSSSGRSLLAWSANQQVGTVLVRSSTANLS